MLNAYDAGPDPPLTMTAGESAGDKELKRLALAWAQAQGYRAAAAEVSLPNYRPARCGGLPAPARTRRCPR